MGVPCVASQTVYEVLLLLYDFISFYVFNAFVLGTTDYDFTVLRVHVYMFMVSCVFLCILLLCVFPHPILVGEITFG